MQPIKCQSCGKLLLEVEYGEGTKICPRCKTKNNFTVTKSFNLVYTDDVDQVEMKDNKGKVLSSVRIRPDNSSI